MQRASLLWSSAIISVFRRAASLRSLSASARAEAMMKSSSGRCIGSRLMCLACARFLGAGYVSLSAFVLRLGPILFPEQSAIHAFDATLTTALYIRSCHDPSASPMQYYGRTTPCMILWPFAGILTHSRSLVGLQSDTRLQIGTHSKKTVA